MAAFTKFNTYFFSYHKGRLTVFQHYPQGDTVWTLRCATAVQRKDGRWERQNFEGGPSRYPRTYDSAYEALKGKVSKTFQDQCFDYTIKPQRTMA